jgi:hypothetical protein
MSESVHSYFDWQVSTLMLAYDTVEPLARTDQQGIASRQQRVEEELRVMAGEVIPKEYLDNPQLEFPPEVVVLLTRATLRRAVEICQSAGEQARG